MQLGVLDGAQVLVVEKITGHRPMPMLSQVGGTIPAHCSGLGRAILAYSRRGHDRRRHRRPGWSPRTPRTITDPDALRRELAAIPDRGWAVDREEGNIGVSCVAAPIFGPLGDVVAALSVTGPTAVVRADRVGPAVRLAAAAAVAGVLEPALARPRSATNRVPLSGTPAWWHRHRRHAQRCAAIARRQPGRG